MSRDFGVDLQTKVAQRTIFVADLVELHLNTALYLTSGAIDFDYDSPTAPDSGVNTYLAQGQFLSFGNVIESSDLRIGQIDITFTAVDQTTIALLINNQYINKRVVIYRAILDENYSFTSNDVFTIFDGRIIGFSIKEDTQTSTVVVTVASQFADFERTNGRRTNPASQSKEFPNDKGFRFSAQVVKDIKWGRT